MRLTDWRRLSFQLAADLQLIERMAGEHGLSELAGRAVQLRQRVEDRRFTVAVVGDFRRGKSTFINAMLGRAILPSDVAPTTATVNRVTYGTRPSVELRFHDGRPPETIEVDQLASNVTKLDDHSAARAAQIREAIVSFPVRFCRNDVDILDTPGLGDEATMTGVTMRELPFADAAILVIMADSPFSETEGQFLDRLVAEGFRELLYVVSALDRIRKPADRLRVVESIRDRVQARLRAAAESHFAHDPDGRNELLKAHSEPRVYGVSALQALEGRLHEDGELVESSGMLAFEAGLERFLTKSDLAGLQRRLEQAERLAREVAAAVGSAHPAAGAVSPVLDRLQALLVTAETAVEAQSRRDADGVVRAGTKLEPKVTRFAAKTKSELVRAIQEQKVSPHWPAKYDEFCASVATALQSTFATLADEFTDLLQSTLQAEADEAGNEAVVEMCQLVLDYTYETLSPRGPLRPVTRPAVSPPPSVGAGNIRDRLPLPEATVVGALKATPVVEAMHKVTRRSAWDALLSLDFASIDARWQDVALPQLETLRKEHVDAVDLPRAAQSVVDRLSEATRRRLDPCRTSLREAQAELLRARERTAAQAERGEADAAKAKGDLESLAGRLQALRAAAGGGG